VFIGSRLPRNLPWTPLRIGRDRASEVLVAGEGHPGPVLLQELAHWIHDGTRNRKSVALQVFCLCLYERPGIRGCTGFLSLHNMKDRKSEAVQVFLSLHNMKDRKSVALQVFCLYIIIMKDRKSVALQVFCLCIICKTENQWLYRFFVFYLCTRIDVMITVFGDFCHSLSWTWRI
jgi:hypothetical protein